MSRSCLLLSLLLCTAGAARAQQHEHEAHHHQAEAPDDSEDEDAPAAVSIPHAREGSGTSWMPDDSAMHAHHFMAGGWMLMLHGTAAFGFDDQLGDRGGHRFASTNWIMGMASHPLLGGDASFRSMLSLEPATVYGIGLPLLLQSGETFHGQPLRDRQHPHDLFMEVSATYRHPIGNVFGIELYAAPSGEPALGPVAFMHRPSAFNDPLPPIGHHWQDSTHVSFGVLTAGVYTQWMKLEGSLFNGREPDENRWDFDFGALDSWSLRASANPTASTSLQVSYGHLVNPEALHPGENKNRVTASAMWTAPMLARGRLDLTALWGRNVEVAGNQDSFLLEANADLDGKNVPFARLEYVEKLGADLQVPGDPDAKYGVAELGLGLVHRFSQVLGLLPTVGARLNVGLVPEALQATYGSRVPLGGFVFIGAQVPQMGMHHLHGGAR